MERPGVPAAHSEDSDAAENWCKTLRLTHLAIRRFLRDHKRLQDLTPKRKNDPNKPAIDIFLDGFRALGIQGDAHSKARKTDTAASGEHADLSLNFEIFDKIVGRLKQPEVLAVHVRQAWRDEFDARHLHRMWSRALYVDDRPVFDASLAPRRELRPTSGHDVVRLAAWLAVDYLGHVEGLSLDLSRQEGHLGERLGAQAGLVKGLAREFEVEQGIAHEGSLWWDRDGFTVGTLRVRGVLEMALADIGKRHPVLTPPLRDLFRECEAALHARRRMDDSGRFVGLRGGSWLWEAMCLHWARIQPSQAVFCFDESIPTGLPEESRGASQEKRRQVFDKNCKERRPDLVLSGNGETVGCVVDFKYYDQEQRIALSRYRSTLSDEPASNSRPIDGSRVRQYINPDQASRTSPLAIAATAENPAQDDHGETRSPKEIVDTLEAYRLLAVIHNLTHGVEPGGCHAESVPIELWVPEVPPDNPPAGDMPLPGLTWVVPASTETLLKAYVGWQSPDRIVP